MPAARQGVQCWACSTFSLFSQFPEERNEEGELLCPSCGSDFVEVTEQPTELAGSTTVSSGAVSHSQPNAATHESTGSRAAAPGATDGPSAGRSASSDQHSRGGAGPSREQIHASFSHGPAMGSGLNFVESLSLFSPTRLPGGQRAFVLQLHDDALMPAFHLGDMGVANANAGEIVVGDNFDEIVSRILNAYQPPTRATAPDVVSTLPRRKVPLQPATSPRPSGGAETATQAEPSPAGGSDSSPAASTAPGASQARPMELDSPDPGAATPAPAPQQQGTPAPSPSAAPVAEAAQQPAEPAGEQPSQELPEQQQQQQEGGNGAGGSGTSGEARCAAVSPGELCTVCHDPFEGGSEVVELPCGHCFHEDCILPWLKQRNTCPVCRARLRVAESSGAAGPTDDVIGLGGAGHVHGPTFQTMAGPMPVLQPSLALAPALAAAAASAFPALQSIVMPQPAPRPRVPAPQQRAARVAPPGPAAAPAATATGMPPTFFPLGPGFGGGLAASITLSAQPPHPRADLSAGLDPASLAGLQQMVTMFSIGNGGGGGGGRSGSAERAQGGAGSLVQRSNSGSSGGGGVGSSLRQGWLNTPQNLYQGGRGGPQGAAGTQAAAGYDRGSSLRAGFLNSQSGRGRSGGASGDGRARRASGSGAGRDATATDAPTQPAPPAGGSPPVRGPAPTFRPSPSSGAAAAGSNGPGGRNGSGSGLAAMAGALARAAPSELMVPPELAAHAGEVVPLVTQVCAMVGVLQTVGMLSPPENATTRQLIFAGSAAMGGTGAADAALQRQFERLIDSGMPAAGELPREVVDVEGLLRVLRREAALLQAMLGGQAMPPGMPPPPPHLLAAARARLQMIMSIVPMPRGVPAPMPTPAAAAPPASASTPAARSSAAASAAGQEHSRDASPAARVARRHTSEDAASLANSASSNNLKNINSGGGGGSDLAAVPDPEPEVVPPGVSQAVSQEAAGPRQQQQLEPAVAHASASAQAEDAHAGACVSGEGAGAPEHQQEQEEEGRSAPAASSQGRTGPGLHNRPARRRVHARGQLGHPPVPAPAASMARAAAVKRPQAVGRQSGSPTGQSRGGGNAAAGVAGTSRAGGAAAAGAGTSAGGGRRAGSGGGSGGPNPVGVVLGVASAPLRWAVGGALGMLGIGRRRSGGQAGGSDGGSVQGPQQVAVGSGGGAEAAGSAHDAAVPLGAQQG